MQRRIAGSIAGIRMVRSRASLLLIVMDTGRALPMPGSQWHAHGKGKNDGAINLMELYTTVTLTLVERRKNG